MLNWSALLVAFGVRITLGVGLGGFGSVAGYFTAWTFMSPAASLQNALAAAVTVTGVGAGLGSFSGWIRLDAGKLTNLMFVCLAVFGGIVGAWGGWVYARTFMDANAASEQARITAISAAPAVANFVLGAHYLARGLFPRTRKS